MSHATELIRLNPAIVRVLQTVLRQRVILHKENLPAPWTKPSSGIALGFEDVVLDKLFKLVD
ncbi:hypothetical protein JCM14076_03110 [Methylosoma difficile]